MLESIYIENFAIIDQLQIDFHDQMTVLTGETGAGKSIIIDAIGQLSEIVVKLLLLKVMLMNLLLKVFFQLKIILLF